MKHNGGRRYIVSLTLAAFMLVGCTISASQSYLKLADLFITAFDFYAC